MVETFSFLGSGKLIIGKGKFSEIQSFSSIGEAALICGKSFLSTDQYRSIKELVLFQFIISGEPDLENIDNITREIRGKIHSVIAVGGGSVLDAGKAVSAMCCEKGSIEEYLEGIGSRIPEGKTLSLIAVPTTAGTGSEATKNAVICRRGKNGYKKSLRHENYIPHLVIIDPELYINCPITIKRSCGMDAFCQLLESFISTDSNIFTDLLAWKGLTIFIDSFIKSCTSEKNNLSIMTDIAFAAYLSGITLANAGLGTVHGIAGPMGGFFNIPHGTACGTLLPEVMKRTISELYNIEKCPSLDKIEKLGDYIINNTGFENKGKSGLAVIEMLNSWINLLKIPRLSEYGIDNLSAKKIAESSGNKNNPVKFSQNEIEEMIVNRI